MNSDPIAPSETGYAHSQASSQNKGLVAANDTEPSRVAIQRYTVK